mmetsp:Transcript_90911/g.208155  ORF Transcript_90911/g.208155 Transcript_90911/m.208155 type:complete len:222 (-) Transcript_90911:358-1023(-)
MHRDHRAHGLNIGLLVVTMRTSEVELELLKYTSRADGCAAARAPVIHHPTRGAAHLARCRKRALLLGLRHTGCVKMHLRHLSSLGCQHCLMLPPLVNLPVHLFPLTPKINRGEIQFTSNSKLSQHGNSILLVLIASQALERKVIQPEMQDAVEASGCSTTRAPVVRHLRGLSTSTAPVPGAATLLGHGSKCHGWQHGVSASVLHSGSGALEHFWNALLKRL